MTYDQLEQLADDEGIEIIEFLFKSSNKGMYSDSVIAINKNIKTRVEKKCILAEELGHHYTTSGNIIDLKNICNRKQELTARKWSYEKLVPLKSLINASFEGCATLYELSEYLDVTEQFLIDTLKYYESKYGLYAELDNYCIYFNPLTVCRYNYEYNYE
jgi:Zn-dependent peptidase ImmA (M78 family)